MVSPPELINGYEIETELGTKVWGGIWTDDPEGKTSIALQFTSDEGGLTRIRMSLHAAVALRQILEHLFSDYAHGQVPSGGG